MLVSWSESVATLFYNDVNIKRMYHYTHLPPQSSVYILIERLLWYMKSFHFSFPLVCWFFQVLSKVSSIFFRQIYASDLGIAVPGRQTEGWIHYHIQQHMEQKHSCLLSLLFTQVCYFVCICRCMLKTLNIFLENEWLFHTYTLTLA